MGFTLDSEKFSKVANKEVKVSCWNIGISAMASNTTNNAGRLNEIAAKLSAKSPDVILLQECWNAEDKTFFKSHFAGTLPHYLTDAVGGSSGLVILSKFPFVHGAFARFTDASGADALANKGVLGGLLDIGEKRLVYIWNTHLNAGGDAVSVRHKQFEQISAFIKDTVTGLQKSVPTVNVGIILAGDLNTNGKSDNQDAYNTMMTKLSNGAVDIFRKKHGPGYNSWPKLTASITCTAGATLRMRWLNMTCPSAGTTSCQWSSALDYGTIMEKAGDKATATMGVSEASAIIPQDASYDFFTMQTTNFSLSLNALSDHPMMLFKVSHESDLVKYPTSLAGSSNSRAASYALSSTLTFFALIISGNRFYSI